MGIFVHISDIIWLLFHDLIRFRVVSDIQYELTDKDTCRDLAQSSGVIECTVSAILSCQSSKVADAGSGSTLSLTHPPKDQVVLSQAR